MFGSEVEMLPVRKGNRNGAKVVCDKTKGLGWRETKSIVDYIDNVTHKNNK